MGVWKSDSTNAVTRYYGTNAVTVHYSTNGGSMKKEYADKIFYIQRKLQE